MAHSGNRKQVPSAVCSGFTLLEIMVSITLLALIALMISRVFNQSSKAVDQGSSDMVLDESARYLLDTLEQDISQSLIRTNVAFRIHPNARNGTLYFISTAARRQHENIARETAPMRLSAVTAGADSSWNGYIKIETADKASGQTAQSLLNLIRHSDYYIHSANPSGSDSGPFFSGNYTQAATAQLEDQAVLSFLDITVNADPDWNYNNLTDPPDPANMPRFVDISIGLIPAAEMNKAIQLNSGQHIENFERIYTRRIFLRNQGIHQLTF